MALKDQNPKALSYAMKTDWAVAWIMQLKGQVWGLIQNGGGGGGSGMVVGDSVTGADANRVLFTDGDSNLAQSDNLTYEEGLLSVNGDLHVSNPLESLQKFEITFGGSGNPGAIFYTSPTGVTSLITFPNDNVSGSDLTIPTDKNGIILVDSQLGVANGIATLDGSIKVPLAQLPFSTLIYKGTWTPDTNTPSLTDGVGTTGDFYLVDIDGSHDWGGRGIINYVAGNGVVYDGSIWQTVGSIINGGVISVSSANTGRITVADGTGNAVLDVVSAPILTNTRTINYVPFNGSANILLNSSLTTVSTSTYTLLTTDNQKKVIMTGGSGTQTVTVPNGFPVGAQIDVVRMGSAPGSAAAVTFVAGSGTNIRSAGNLLSITNQYNAVTLTNVGTLATNEWLLVGALS